MKRLITAAIAGSLLASAALPVAAQTYQQSQGDYERQMREYETNRSQYDRDRAEYDRRYGAGAYERYNNSRPQAAPQYPTPQYPTQQYGDRDDRYGRNDRNDRNDPYSRYASSPCEQRYNNQSSGNRTGGTVIGALIGGALGAAAAGDSSTTEGAVLGALVGGVIGNSAAGRSASANDDRYAAKCDASGYYFSYDQTSPYRESARNRNNRSGRYDNTYYSRQRCRLAVAPADAYGRVEYRYVRVCPDRNNRYRITS